MSRFRSISGWLLVFTLGWAWLGPCATYAALVNWDGEDFLNNLNWSNGLNWNPNGVPLNTDSVVFNDVASSATAGTVTNIVDTTPRQITAITFSSTTASNTHTTQISGTLGQTFVTDIVIGNVAGTTVTNIKGGTLNGSVLSIAPTLSNSSVVDMSQLSSMTLSGVVDIGSGNTTSSTVTLPNSMTLNGGNSQYFRFSTRGTTGNSLRFGQTTILRAGEMSFGGGYNSTSSIGFRSGLSPNPTLTIRGHSDGRAVVNESYIGGHRANAPGGVTAVMDLTAAGGTAGQIDALFSTLNIGNKVFAATGDTTGSLIYDLGTVEAATLNLGYVEAAPTNGTVTGNLTLEGTGSLVVTTMNLGRNQSTTGGNTSAANGVLNLSGGTVRAGSIQLGALVNGSRSGTINFNGGTIRNIASGNLTIGSGLTFNSLTTGTHTFEADSGQSITVNSALVGAGTGDVVKTGAGLLNLNAANTYAGNTVISSGTLALGAGGSLTSPSISVAASATFDVGSVSGGFTLGNGQTLKGTGTVSGDFTAGVGSTIAPGNSIGTLLVNDDLVLADGSLFQFELAAPGTNDLISMTGSVLTLNNQEFGDFTFIPQGSFGLGTYVLIDAGSIGGSLGGSVSGPIGGYTGTLQVQGSNLVLTVVPEPTPLLLMLCGMVALWHIRRK